MVRKTRNLLAAMSVVVFLVVAGGTGAGDTALVGLSDKKLSYGEQILIDGLGFLACAPFAAAGSLAGGVGGFVVGGLCTIGFSA